MLDINKRKYFIAAETTVEDLIKKLSEYPANAKVGVCGENGFYIHEEENGCGISFDISSLDEYYNDISK